MRVAIHVNLDNASFQGGYGPHELKVILEAAAWEVGRNHFLHETEDFPLFDSNGNEVGGVTFRED